MPYICVVGGANIDIVGKPFTDLKTFDSNPGQVRLSLGGVGRNIAENLARLDNDVKLLTVLATDLYTQMIKTNAADVGIDLSHSLVVENSTSTTYLCMTDSKGDMFVGMSDMKLLDSLNAQYLATKLDVLNNAACVVCDTNIPQCLEFLQQNVTVPLFLDTVSAKKTMLVKDNITNIFCIKPNVYEAEILAEQQIFDTATMHSAIAKIHAKGVSWVIVTDGAKGVTFSDGRQILHMPSLACEIVNTTGAGDSFVAGLVHGYVRGRSLSKCVEQGSKMSAVTIASSDTVSQHISCDIFGD